MQTQTYIVVNGGYRDTDTAQWLLSKNQSWVSPGSPICRTGKCGEMAFPARLYISSPEFAVPELCLPFPSPLRRPLSPVTDACQYGAISVYKHLITPDPLHRDKNSPIRCSLSHGFLHLMQLSTNKLKICLSQKLCIMLEKHQGIRKLEEFQRYIMSSYFKEEEKLYFQTCKNKITI